MCHLYLHINASITYCQTAKYAVRVNNAFSTDNDDTLQMYPFHL